MAAHVEECRWKGESGIRLTAGALTATFLPDVGMTGVSVRYAGAEYLALPGGVDALRAGSTGGLPLLAPWANRLASRQYRAAGFKVDLRRKRIHTDENGLPIHGLLVGRSGWNVEAMRARGASATLVASFDLDQAAFPYPHRITVTARAKDGQLDVDTTIVPTARRRVPISFGWHPYLRVPGTARGGWTLRMPARDHLELDDRGIPTSESQRAEAEAEPIGRRRFDDLFELGRDKRLAFASDERSVELRCGAGYGYAQVWVPPGKPFGALEPMTAPTNALVDGSAPVVTRGDNYTARFSLVFT